MSEVVVAVVAGIIATGEVVVVFEVAGAVVFEEVAANPERNAHETWACSSVTHGKGSRC